MQDKCWKHLLQTSENYNNTAYKQAKLGIQIVRQNMP